MGLNTGGSTVSAFATRPAGGPARLRIPPNVSGTYSYGTPPGYKPSTPAPSPYVLSPADEKAAEQAVMQQVNPLAAGIRANTLATGKAGAGLITGYTNNAIAKLGGINFGAPYAGAAQGENAINTALLASLKGQGSDLQNELGQALAQAGIDPNAAAGVTNRVGADTSGAANAGLARGDATLSSLLQAGAAARSYGNALPGIEGLAGQQDMSKLTGQLANQQASQLTSLNAKVPGLVQSAESAISSSKAKQAGVDAANLRSDHSITAAGARSAATITAADKRAAASDATRRAEIDATERKTKALLIISSNIGDDGRLTPDGIAQLKQLGITSSGLAGSGGASVAKTNITVGERNRHDQIVEGQTDTKIKIQQQNANTAATRADNAATKYNNSQQPKFSASNSRALGYVADQYGNPVGKTLHLLPGYKLDPKGHVVKTSSSAATHSHGLTQSQALKLQGTAETLAQQAANGFTDAKGVHHDALTREQADVEARKEGLPTWAWVPAQFRAFGRPHGEVTVKSKGPLGIQASLPPEA